MSKSSDKQVILMNETLHTLNCNMFVPQELHLEEEEKLRNGRELETSYSYKYI